MFRKTLNISQNNGLFSARLILLIIFITGLLILNYGNNLKLLFSMIFIVYNVGVKIFLSLARASSMNDAKLSSSSKYWSETDNLNVSSYLRKAKVIIEPRHRLHNIVIFVRFIVSNTNC